MPTTVTTANAVLVRQDGILNNRLIVIRIGDTVAATDGDLLDVIWTSHFSTKYDPLYADARRIRAEYGRFILDIPNDTINQLCWKWSKRADILRSTGLKTNRYYGTGAEDGTLTAMIKADYVACKVALDLLTGSPDNAGHQKSLADLRVSRSSGALNDAIERAYACGMRMETALKEGGFLGQRAQGTVKGARDIGRPTPSRIWSTNNAVPAANAGAYEIDRNGRRSSKPRRTFGRLMGRKSGKYRGF